MGDLQDRQKERIARAAPTDYDQVEMALILVQNELNSANRYSTGASPATQHALTAIEHLAAAVRELAARTARN